MQRYALLWYKYLLSVVCSIWMNDSIEGSNMIFHVWSLLLHKFSKTLRKWRKHWHTLFYILITLSYESTLLKTVHDSCPVQIIIILHLLCVAPCNKHNKMPCINSTRSREFTDLYTAFVPVHTWQLKACSTGIYAIISHRATLVRRCSSSGTASASGSRGHGFDTRPRHTTGVKMAQAATLLGAQRYRTSRLIWVAVWSKILPDQTCKMYKLICMPVVKQVSLWSGLN